MGLHRRHRRSRPLPLPQRRPQSARPARAHGRSSPAAGVSAAAATGRAISPSPRTVQSSSSPSAPTPTSTTLTPIPKNSIAPTSSSSRPRANSSKIYAWGIRNCVGEAINPTTGELWCSTNERDALGNNLVPDYITHVAGGRLLRLAVVSTWAVDARTRATRASTLSCKSQSPHARHPSPAALRLARDDLLRGLAVPRRVQRRRLRLPSTAPGTAPCAPATKSSACPCRTATPPANTKTSSPASSRGWRCLGPSSGVAVARRLAFLSDDGSRSIWHVIYTGKP